MIYTFTHAMAKCLQALTLACSSTFLTHILLWLHFINWVRCDPVQVTNEISMQLKKTNKKKKQKGGATAMSHDMTNWAYKGNVQCWLMKAKTSTNRRGKAQHTHACNNASHSQEVKSKDKHYNWGRKGYAEPTDYHGSRDETKPKLISSRVIYLCLLRTWSKPLNKQLQLTRVSLQVLRSAVWSRIDFHPLYSDKDLSRVVRADRGWRSNARLLKNWLPMLDQLK